MELTQAFIILIDISGYTKFIQKHRVSLIHAESIITELLESVIDASEHPLILNKLQGDAALFYARSDGRRETAQEVLGQLQRFFIAFAKRETLLVSECSLCSCEACLSAGQLKLKVIAHHGEVAVKQVKQFEEIAGSDVILAHRLLKNTVKGGEYLMLSKALHELCGSIDGREPELRKEHCEGIGEVEVMVYYPEGAVRETPVAKVSFWDKLRMVAKMEMHSLKRLISRPAKEYVNFKESQKSR